jgi:hypothetical protein
MALLIRGESKCPICGDVIRQTDDVVATPAFLRATHRLSRFSDATFHLACFDASPEHEKVEQLLHRFRQLMLDAPNSIEEYELGISRAFADLDNE